MAVSNELPVLTALKTLIEGLTFSSPMKSLTGVYIDPDDFEAKRTVSPPFAVVALNEANDISVSQHFMNSKKQTLPLVIRVYLEDDHPIPQTQEYSAIRLKARSAIQTIHDGFLSDKKLGGAILTPIVNFDARMVYMSLQDNPYTGFEIEFTAEQSIGQ